VPTLSRVTAGQDVDHEGDEVSSSSYAVLVGVCMGLLASIAINIGQNMQALGLRSRKLTHIEKPVTSTTFAT